MGFVRPVLAMCLAAGCALAAAGADGFYVWQRQWSEKVGEAVDAELAADTHDLYVLGGELEFADGAPRWRGPEVPAQVWRRPRVTAVLRLPVPALGDPDGTAARVVSRACALGVRRVQLDVDVPESRMGRYAGLVEGVRRRWPASAGALRLGATFLPCHLDGKDVRRVLSALDEPVIQLHGIDAPENRAGRPCGCRRA